MKYEGMRLEEHCPRPFFEREYRLWGGEAIFQHAQEADQEARTVFHLFGRKLSELVMIDALPYDPQVLVCGGSISAAFDLFEPGLREGLEHFSYRRVIERLVSDRSELDNASMLGAAALAVSTRRSPRLNRRPAERERCLCSPPSPRAVCAPWRRSRAAARERLTGGPNATWSRMRARRR